MKLLKDHAKVLEALAEGTRSGYDFYCLTFRDVMSISGIEDRSKVRRICRSLARKGLAQYAKGLWNDDGEPAGAGYHITKAGQAVVSGEFLGKKGEMVSERGDLNPGPLSPQDSADD